MWGTMLYNYDSPMVMDFLISNACFWLEVFHVDGLRMDDVDAMLYLDYGRKDGWTPNMYGSNENLQAIEFLKHLNSILKKRDPGALLIAQEDGLWPELTDSVESCLLYTSIAAFEVDDLGILAAKLDGNIRLGRNLLKRSGYRNYLLYKRNAKVVGEGKSAGACDHRMKGKLSKFAISFRQKLCQLSLIHI